MTTRIIAMREPFKHQGQTLTPGTAELPGSCYRVVEEVRDLLVNHGFAADAPDALQPVDMTHLTVDAGTTRYADGAELKPADINAAS